MWCQFAERSGVAPNRRLERTGTTRRLATAVAAGRDCMNEAVAGLELVGIRRGLDCEYDPNAIKEDVDKSAERRKNRRNY